MPDDCNFTLFRYFWVFYLDIHSIHGNGIKSQACNKSLIPLSANRTKWSAHSNNLSANCFGVFDQFVRLACKESIFQNHKTISFTPHLPKQFQNGFTDTANQLTLIKMTRKQSHRVVLWKGFLRNSATFTGKYLCQSLFFNKFAGLRPVTSLKKETLAQVFSCEFCGISKNTFSYRAPAVVASDD